LKALFLKSGSEFDLPIIDQVKKKYSHIEFVHTLLSTNNLVDRINESGQISLVVISIKYLPLNIKLILEQLNESLGIIPIIFIGQINLIQRHLDELYPEENKSFYFLAQPFQESQFLDTFNAAITWVKENEFQQSVNDFDRSELQEIRIKNFYLFNEIPYDTYLQLTSLKYGKIIQGNYPYSHYQIYYYAQKGVKYLYLKKDDHLKFLSSSIINISKFYTVKNLEIKKIILLHQQSVFFIHEFVKLVSVTEDVIKLTQLLIESCDQLIRLETDLNMIFQLVIQNRAIIFAQQTLLSIYLSRSILLKMRWFSDMAFNKLALAAILQDIYLENDQFIGISSIKDPLFKSLTEEEQIIFFEHPQKAANLARVFHGFTDVDFILEEHHERPTSDGFPKQSNSSTLSTVSCIFILVNNIISNISKSTSYSATTLKDIYTHLRPNFKNGNSKDPFKALEKIVKDL
jgi:hypothetical protein